MPRARIVAAGGVAAVVLAGVLLALGRPSPAPTTSPGPAASASPSSAPAAVNVLPTPTTADVVLLVGSPDALTATEQAWLADLRTKFGRVDTLADASASLEALLDYLTVFVVDASPNLDAAVLRSAFQAGMTIHLIGAAAEYRAAVLAVAEP